MYSCFLEQTRLQVIICCRIFSHPLPAQKKTFRKKALFFFWRFYSQWLAENSKERNCFRLPSFVRIINRLMPDSKVMQFPKEVLAGEQISARVLSAHCQPVAEQRLAACARAITSLYPEYTDGLSRWNFPTHRARFISPIRCRGWSTYWEKQTLQVFRRGIDIMLEKSGGVISEAIARRYAYLPFDCHFHSSHLATKCWCRTTFFTHFGLHKSCFFHQGLFICIYRLWFSCGANQFLHCTINKSVWRK